MQSITISRLQGWLLCAFLLVFFAYTRTSRAAAETSSDQFRNPILFADYSDPDVIRDGANYYLVASTFHFVPGIPILESPDLVHWKIIGHVVNRLDIDPRYDLDGGDRYGGGIWAPAIRKHNGLFYVYFPTPQEGIFVSTAPKITGPWSAPTAVISQAGLEDPCPFWDDDGNAYLIHSKKGAGPLILHRMSPDGKHVLDEGKVIAEDREHLPTLEGPKFYKRNGYYYVFAPFGGVGTGSQVALRSRNIWGPYEQRVVLAQGSTKINGPHQGGYVETPNGEGWFVHFQSHGAHGRIVHLQPVRWESDWPVMGKPVAGQTAGEPILAGPMPDHNRNVSHQKPQTSDEFNSADLGPQWEWSHNPDDRRWSLKARPGFMRLVPTNAGDLFTARNTLTQCMQDDSFEFTARIDLSGMKSGVHAGIAMFEKLAGGLEIVQSGTERRIYFFHAQDRTPGPVLSQSLLQLRVSVKGDEAIYFFSTDDGHSFQPLGTPTQIQFSWWKGSRPSLFAYTTQKDEAGTIDVDWVHYEPRGNF